MVVRKFSQSGSRFILLANVTGRQMAAFRPGRLSVVAVVLAGISLFQTWRGPGFSPGHEVLAKTTTVED